VEDNLITKIRNTVAKNGKLQEADVRSLMIILRKLLDKMPQSDQQSFSTVRLFANWVAHVEITQSNTGLRILSTINSALVTYKDSADTDAMRATISQEIGFPTLRREMRLLFGRIGVDDRSVSDNDIWAVLVTHLIEIIRDVSLSFPAVSTLDRTKRNIYEGIARNPIKPGAEVIAIRISRVDYAAHGAKGMGELMCLIITTEDGITIVMPLLIDVRV